MSLLFGDPPPPPTHPPPDHAALMELAGSIRKAAAAANARGLTAELLSSVAEAQSVPVANCYAAAGVAMMTFASVHEYRFVVCTGRCQMWGSLDRLEHLLHLREEREGRGGCSFDVHAAGCLDVCHKPPAAQLVTPDGTAVLPELTDELVAESLTLIDEASQP